MALSLQPLFKNAVRQFTTVVSDDRFQTDFIDAVNVSLDDLSDAADLDASMAHVAGHLDSVPELNDDDMYILLSGVVYNLVMFGREHVIRDNSFQILKGDWEEKKGQFMVNKSHSDQESVEDNLSGQGASIMGLGDVTEIDRTGD